MASFYILHSESADKFYIGATKHLENRIDLHLNKDFQNSFTAKFQDWRLFLSIDELDISTARKIELHVKKMKSRKYILDLAKYPEMKDKLINKFQIPNNR